MQLWLGKGTYLIGPGCILAVLRLRRPRLLRRLLGLLLGLIGTDVNSGTQRFTFGVTEMMGAAQKEAAGSFRYLESFLVVACLYWIMVEVLSVGQRWMERHLGRAVAR